MTPDPLDRAAAAFRALPTPDRPPDSGVLARLNPPVTPRWRAVVSRTALFAVAAAVVAGVGLLLATPSVALADVPKAAEKHKLVKYRIVFRHERKTQEAYEQVATAYADLHASRHHSEQRDLNWNEYVETRQVIVIDWTADRTLSTLVESLVPDKPVRKFFQEFPGTKADRFPRRVAILARAFALDFEPTNDQRKPFLARLRDLAAHPKAVAGKTPAFGPAVTRFRIEDGPKTTELWVDAGTRLPVRMRYELFRPMEAETLRWTYTDFEWDPELPDGVKSLDGLFSVEPPAGYTLDDRTGKP